MREVRLSSSAANDGDEHIKVRHIVFSPLISSLPKRIPPFAVAKDTLRLHGHQAFDGPINMKFDAKIKTLVKGANKIVNKLEAVTTRLASFNKGLAKASQFLETQLQGEAVAEDQAWEGATVKPETLDESNSWLRDDAWWSVLKRDIDEIHCLILESEPFESIDDVKSLVKEEGCSSFNRKAAKSFNEHDCDIDFVFEADARDSDVIDDGERSVNCQTSPDSPKDKVTAGPAKVRTLGTFLAELLVREEEFLSFPVASDGDEHNKVRISFSIDNFTA